ncbi:AhpD family alkylhydroperoxidase [Haloactinospora alba]|uniref:AhpD family alkylhydroperoxidase n=1 Tax=Haloactinospora alba TaxID=405555 RepID=A0A543NL43_9ACTN|nr:carboxymuconolactone decarboxylase family protein [Haloactinospora alba]TQN32563.1 AhpD family alkylhydroperoxidase [Haloactinospora alba]
MTAEAVERVSAVAELPQVLGKVREARRLLHGTLGENLAELVELRCSYLNGCAFCIDMHARDAAELGEERRRLFTVAGWHEARNHFTPAEQAALALADEVTRLGEGGVSDGVYARAAEHYPPEELAALIATIGVMNLFNRVMVATGSQPPDLD